MEITQRNICFCYHGDRDGMASCLAFHEWTRRHNRDKAAWRTLEVAYGLDASDITGELPDRITSRGAQERETAIILADFVPHPGVVRSLLRSGYDVLVIDHHETTPRRIAEVCGTKNPPEMPDGQRWLSPWSQVLLPGSPPSGSPGKLGVVFDPNHAACTITWSFLMDGEPVPELLKYVEDRDLWNWSLAHSRPISYLIGSYERTVMAWRTLQSELSRDFVAAIHRGKAIEQHVDRQIERIASGASLGSIAFHDVAAVCAPTYQSELGHRLLEEAEDINIAAIWHATDEGLAVSLRTSEHVNAAEIAEHFGGGGHKRAAGFFIKADELGRHRRGEDGLTPLRLPGILG